MFSFFHSATNNIMKLQQTDKNIELVGMKHTQLHQGSSF